MSEIPMRFPTVMWTETHPVGCFCGLCNNTACQATIRVECYSLADYERAIQYALRRRDA